MNYQEIANQIIETVGGLSNISSITHCMTRLRFVIIDKSKVDEEALKQIEGVLGVVDATGQLQIVLGKNLLATYAEVEKIYNQKSLASSDNQAVAPEKEALTFKKAVNDIVGFIGSSVTPMVPGLVAGGMFKLFLLLATLIYPAFADSSTYTMLGFIADSAFYFMPLFTSFGVAKQMGSTPIFAMIACGALIYPDFVSLVSEGTTVSLFSINVLLVKYSSTLIPAILISYVAAKLELFFNKVIPGIFRAVLVGVLTIGVSGALGYLILGPIGEYLGSYIMIALNYLQATVGPLAVAVLAAFLPFIIMAGIHHLFSPFIVQSLSTNGYDAFFRPSLILHNISEGGACFAIALRTKNIDLRAEAISCGIGCIFAGVTEPALYGIMLRLKKPLYGVMAGGATGGLVAGLLGAKAFVMGYSSILAIPIFQTTMIAIIAGITVSFVVSFLTVYFFAFKDLEG